MSDTRRILSLNGTWRLTLDPEDAGMAASWHIDEPEDHIEVSVPSVWDLWAPDYDGVGWYFRDFDLDDPWRGQSIFLEFDAADYHAEVWLNGTRLGDHEGGYTPFSFDATDAAVIGANHLAVRIIDPHGPEGYGDFRPKEIPSSKEEGYFSFAGIWGDVRVVGKPKNHIVDVFIQPDLRHNVVNVTLETTGGDEARIEIEGTTHSVTGKVGRLTLPFPDFEPWSPDSPRLYTLNCALLTGGNMVDHMSVRFGMREFTVRENRFWLNNHPIFLKGVLHQPDYARTLAAPESVELARRELKTAKAAGFNLIRLHIKTAPKITLELADELGLMLYEEPPIGWIKNSPWLKERCEREVREMILRDRNHASVVIWGMLNESGNAGYEINGGAQLVKDDLCKLARSLDPTRVIIDDSGGVNATRESARFMRPYRDEFEEFDDLHIYQRAPVDQEIEQYYRSLGDDQKLLTVSEFGFGGMEDLEDVIAQYGEDKDKLKDARFLQKMLDAAKQGFAERELDRLFGGFSEFTAATRELQCDAVRFQIDAMRSNPLLAGYCYTQLCDAGHEFCAGVMDRWRRPKRVMKMLKEVQHPLRPLIHIEKTNLVPREEVDVKITLINEHKREGRVDISLQVVGPTNQVLWKKKRAINLPRNHREIWTGSISASGTTGAHRFVVRLIQGMRLIAQNSVDIQVITPAVPCDVQIEVMGPRGDVRDRCLALAQTGAERAIIHVVPPLANTIRAYPGEALAEVLAEVREGAAAIFFGIPDDWNDLANHIDSAVTATNKDSVGAFLGTYHYVKLHPVFEGLPARCLMNQTYSNIVPPKTFLEASEEDICGAFDTTPIAVGNYMMGETAWWGSDILVRRYGSGRLVFTHLRILENLGTDPVADHLFVNLLRHFSRRVVLADHTPVSHVRIVEWLRRERAETLRYWKVIGMFDNWGDRGHDTAYPPEDILDFNAVYPGWYKPVAWKSWYTHASKSHVLDFQEAFTPLYEYYPRFDYGTGYAYAEFMCDRRATATMKLAVQDAMKVWLNGHLVFVDTNHRPHKTLETFEIPVSLKQGRNSVLVKVSKVPGEFQFGLDIESILKDPVNISWWR